MNENDDSPLVNEAQNGSRQAFNELVRLHQERLYWVVRRMVRDHDQSLDILQDVFIRAYDALPNFRGESKFFTWLYRIATNLSLNYLRKRKLRPAVHLDELEDVLPDHQESGHDVLERKEFRKILERAIERLPAKQKAVFILRYYEELPYEEISKIMNRTTGGLKANFFHAVRKIEEYVKKEL